MRSFNGSRPLRVIDLMRGAGLAVLLFLVMHMYNGSRLLNAEDVRTVHAAMAAQGGAVQAPAGLAKSALEAQLAQTQLLLGFKQQLESLQSQNTDLQQKLSVRDGGGAGGSPSAVAAAVTAALAAQRAQLTPRTAGAPGAKVVVGLPGKQRTAPTPGGFGGGSGGGGGGGGGADVSAARSLVAKVSALFGRRTQAAADAADAPGPPLPGKLSHYDLEINKLMTELVRASGGGQAAAAAAVAGASSRVARADPGKGITELPAELLAVSSGATDIIGGAGSAAAAAAASPSAAAAAAEVTGDGADEWDGETVVDDVLAAMRQGELDAAPRPLEQLTRAPGGAKKWWDLIDHELHLVAGDDAAKQQQKPSPHPFTMLELGGGASMAALWVAQHRPDSTVLSVQQDGSGAGSRAEDAGSSGGSDGAVTSRMGQLRDRLNLRNLLLGHSRSLGGAVRALVAAADLRFHFLSLPDLAALASEDMLPHEFESLLGRVLPLARTLFVQAPLPDSRFFSYWKDADALVQAAARTAGAGRGVHGAPSEEKDTLRVHTKSLRKGGGWHNPSTEVLRVDVYVRRGTPGAGGGGGVGSGTGAAVAAGGAAGGRVAKTTAAPTKTKQRKRNVWGAKATKAKPTVLAKKGSAGAGAAKAAETAAAADAGNTTLPTFVLLPVREHAGLRLGSLLSSTGLTLSDRKRLFSDALAPELHRTPVAIAGANSTAPGAPVALRDVLFEGGRLRTCKAATVRHKAALNETHGEPAPSKTAKVAAAVKAKKSKVKKAGSKLDALVGKAAKSGPDKKAGQKGWASSLLPDLPSNKKNGSDLTHGKVPSKKGALPSAATTTAAPSMKKLGAASPPVTKAEKAKATAKAAKLAAVVAKVAKKEGAGKPSAGSGEKAPPVAPKKVAGKVRSVAVKAVALKKKLAEMRALGAHKMAPLPPVLSSKLRGAAKNANQDHAPARRRLLSAATDSASAGARHLLFMLRPDNVGDIAAAERLAEAESVAAAEQKATSKSEKRAKRRARRARGHAPAPGYEQPLPDEARLKAAAAAKARAANARAAAASASAATQPRLGSWSGDNGFGDQGQLQMVQTERDSFELWWPVLQNQLPPPPTEAGAGKGDWSAIVQGRNLGLLSAKLALHNPAATVVTVKHAADHTEAHLALLSLLRVRNNLVGAADLLSSPSVLARLHITADPRRYQVLGADTLELLFLATIGGGGAGTCDVTGFEHALGMLVALASSTILQVPDWGALVRTSAFFAQGSSCPATWLSDRYDPSGRISALNPKAAGSAGPMLSPYSTMLSVAMARAGRQGASMRPIVRASTSQTGGAAGRTAPVGSGFLRIDLEPWARRGADGPVPAAGAAGTAADKAPLPGVSLQSLLQLGVVPAMKAELVRLYLELPLARIVRHATRLDPASVRFLPGPAGGSLVFFERGAEGKAPTPFAVDANTQQSEYGLFADVQAQLFEKDIMPSGEFSFMHYDAGGGALAMRLAQQFPNATVLSIEPREKAVKRHLASLRSLWKDNKGRNNVVCQQTVDNNLLQKLYESPEFLRYQLVGRSVVDLLVEKSRDDIGKYFGYLFSCGMTTFLRLPEAQIFSLMMSTFFGALPADAASSPRFELTKHPLPAFESLEARLFSTLLKAPAGGTTKVLVRRLPGASVPLLRVDLVKMTRPVNHHFDYARDGHKRKYIMHLARNDSVLVDPLNAAPWEHAKGLQQRIAGNPWTGASGLPLGFHHNAGGIVGLYLTRDHVSDRTATASRSHLALPILCCHTESDRRHRRNLVRACMLGCFASGADRFIAKPLHPIHGHPRHHAYRCAASRPRRRAQGSRVPRLREAAAVRGHGAVEYRLPGWDARLHRLRHQG